MRTGKSVLNWTGRLAGGAAAATMSVSLWQYYKLRRDYKPLQPPKGALSGIEGCTAMPATESNAENEDACQIIFLGDSLVIGIGCPDRSEGPVFARRISHVTAQALRRRVTWKVIGINGGDVRSIRTALLNQVKHIPATGTPKVKAVVIMCGLNDYKRLVQEGRLPASFREDLRELITSVKERVGSDVRILLPAIPVDKAPLFQSIFPMNQVLYQIADTWDHQKWVLSGEDAGVEFVTKPPKYTAEDWASDGVHPSENGYTKWADHIAVKMVQGLLPKVDGKEL